MKKIYSLLVLVCLTTSGLFAQLIINEVLYDPSNSGLAGDANGDGVYGQEEDAFIEFVNNGSTNLNVGNYQIWDDTTSGSLVYTIPANTIIPPGGALVIFGGGTPTGTFGGAIVLADTGSAGLSLNNSGEVIVIKNAAGLPILSYDTDALSDNPNRSYTRNPDITGAFETHNQNTTLLFSPGTKVNGSSFNSQLAEDVTFSVDMSAYQGTFNGVFIQGTFNNFCGGCNPLTDANGDGVWEITIPIATDSIDYKFTLDTLSVQETFNGTETCVKNRAGVINRFSLIAGITNLPTVCFNSCVACTNIGLTLQGVLDFTTPVGGSSGKAIHLIADSNIANLNIYGIGVANNGGGTDGQEYTFPNISVSAGNHILVVRDSQALADYFSNCWSVFDVVLTQNTDGISQNGDDAIELFRANVSIDSLGDPNVDGSGQFWEYEDAWAYRADTGWRYGTPNCTDNTTTIYDASCRYPICPDILATSIIVEGENNVSTITALAGTLQMIATLLPANAEDTTVTWSVNNPSIGTIDANGLLTAVANGVVEVKATANDGSAIFGTKNITISNQINSIDGLYAASIKIYPNPAATVLNVSSSLEISGIKVVSISGQQMISQANASSPLDISKLDAGMYFVEVEINKSWSRFKIVKQ